MAKKTNMLFKRDTSKHVAQPYFNWTLSWYYMLMRNDKATNSQHKYT